MLTLLYLLTAAALLWLSGRFVRSVSRPAAVVLIAIPLALTGAAVVTGGVWGPIDHLYEHEPLRAYASEAGVGGGAKNASAIDIISEFFPWRRVVQLSFARGEWPLWNAYNLAGHPLAAEAQSAPFLPFTWVAILLPAAVSMTYTAAIGLFVAALGAFLFTRELGCREVAALVAAAGWGYASCNVLYILTAMGFATVFLPLILLGALRCIRAPGVASCILLTTALALTILSGHPESLFLNVVVGAIYGAFELVRNRRNALRAIGAAIVAGLLALAISAIALLPLLEALPQSTEYHLKQTIMGERSQRVANVEVLAHLAANFYPHLHVKHWLQPNLGQIGAETAAVGSLVLSLALYAVWRRRSAETWFFAALALFCMLSGARWSAIADLAMHLPVMELTMLHRLAFSAALLLVILAALGVEELLRRDDRRAAAITLAIVTALLFAGLLWLRANVTIMPAPTDYGRYRVLAEILFPIAAAVLLLMRRIGTAAMAPLLLALVIGQRALSEIDTFPTFPAKAAYPEVALFEPLERVREPFRIVAPGLVFPPSTNVFYGLEDPRGYEALTLDEFQRTWKLWSETHGIWFNRVDDLTSPFLSFLNVRFAVQRAADAVPAGWREVRIDRGSRLLENERALERIFVPRHVEVTGASAIEIVDRMAALRDFRELAYVTARERRGLSANGPGSIRVDSYSPGGAYAFTATMQNDGWVVISECSWKGWRASVDGARVPLHRANAAFLALFLPAGDHDVRLVYRPTSFIRGRAISFATLGALVVFGIARWAVRRRRGDRLSSVE